MPRVFLGWTQGVSVFEGLPWDSLAEHRLGGSFRKVHEPSLSLGLGEEGTDTRKRS